MRPPPIASRFAINTIVLGKWHLQFGECAKTSAHEPRLIWTIVNVSLVAFSPL